MNSRECLAFSPRERESTPSRGGFPPLLARSHLQNPLQIFKKPSSYLRCTDNFNVPSSTLGNRTPTATGIIVSLWAARWHFFPRTLERCQSLSVILFRSCRRFIGSSHPENIRTRLFHLLATRMKPRTRERPSELLAIAWNRVSRGTEKLSFEQPNFPPDCDYSSRLKFKRETHARGEN